MRRAVPFLTVAFVVFLLVPAPGVAGQEDVYETDNVFMVFIDGVRYTESFGNATHELIPHIWNDMRPNGTIHTEFRNMGLTETVPGHASAMTGTWQPLPNDGTQRPSKPTVFEVYRKETGAEKSDVWVVSGKNKLEALTYSTANGYGMSYQASFRGAAVEWNDTSTWGEVEDVMDNHHPSMMMVNLAETDIDAHTGSWDAYTTALRGADKIVWRLWKKIQADPVYKDKTTLIVTDDHGRHDPANGDFQHHGDGCEGCRHIMYLAIGPDIKKGVELSTPQNTLVDVAPTTALLMGFEMPSTTGEVMEDVLTHLPPPATTQPGATQAGNNATGFMDSELFLPIILIIVVVAVVAVVVVAIKARKGDKVGERAGQATEMNVCRACARQFPTGMVSCPGCGARKGGGEFECPLCGADLIEGMRKCPGCGEEMEW